MLGEQKGQENGLRMCGEEAEMVLGQQGWRQECSAGKEQAALKGRENLKYVNARQKNDTELMNDGQFVV